MPYDFNFLIENFFKNWRPDIASFVDSEIWPNFILKINKEKIPLILLNARITKKSFQRWRVLGKSTKKIFGCFSSCISSSTITSHYLNILGAQNIKFYGNIKFCSSIEKDSHNKNQFNTHITVDHLAPNCKSNQFFKGVLSDESKAVFSGKIFVEKGAQNTYATQIDLNLLMSKGAEIDTKPSLEIYADDVECSHGATAGNVDENTLYYMMSRGLKKETATRMLVRGFVDEMINSISDDKIRKFASNQTELILPNLAFK